MKCKFYFCAVLLSGLFLGGLGCEKGSFAPPSVPLIQPTMTLTAVPISPSVTPVATVLRTATPVVSFTSTPLPVVTDTPAPTSTPILSGCGTTIDTPSQADNWFTGVLYGWYQSQSGNLFYSPFSILTAMGMAQEGANGPTACQMQTALDLNADPSVRRPAIQQWINQVSGISRPYTISTADNLWVQQGFNINPAYTNVLQSYYSSGVTNVDFVGNPSGSLQTINGAVSQETNGKIPNLLSPSNINSQTKLILTNAVYFQADWQTQFLTTSTYPQNFNKDASDTESVSMMHQNLSIPVGSFNGAASVVAIPYKGNGASMYIFLPPLGGMAALESQLTGSQIQSWLEANAAAMIGPGLFNTQVQLALPKFTFSTTYDLTQSLGQMMPLAFTRGAADFSGIDGGLDLYITAVVHQAFVDVSETGTTAAAATGIIVGSFNSYEEPPTYIPFIVDHPFVFMIVDNTSNSVLFMGRVDDPTAH